MTVEIRRLDQRGAQVSDAAINGLRGSVAGSVALPGEPGYDEARTLWNAMVDRRPALVVRAAGAADVVGRGPLRPRPRPARSRAQRRAPDRRPRRRRRRRCCSTSRRCARSASIREARTARVEPGATLAEVDAATQAHGLAVPMGINSTTGIAGLTLGGGFGWTSPQARHDYRQPARRRRRDRRRRDRARQRRREPRPLLGGPRRRRQLRRGHRLRVRPAPARP